MNYWEIDEQRHFYRESLTVNHRMHSITNLAWKAHVSGFVIFFLLTVSGTRSSGYAFTGVMGDQLSFCFAQMKMSAFF